MKQNYEEVVREWYNRLRPEFMRRLTAKYSGLTLSDAENIYQDTFIAVHENLVRGKVKEDTSWRNYIMTIGMNLAGKEWRRARHICSADEGYNDEEDGQPSVASKVEDLLKTLPKGEDDVPMCRNVEILSILGEEVALIPEPCHSIIRLHYNDGLSMDKIAQKIGYKNADTVKAKKSQCMKGLINRVTSALNRAGYDVKPKKRNRNGKN